MIDSDEAYKKLIDEGFIYFVCFLDDENNVHHIVGYETRPDVINLTHLFEELKTDKEFNLDPKEVERWKVRIFKYVP